MDTFIQPENVLIVDSASPVKPNDKSFTTTRHQYIQLLNNPGHSQNCLTHYSGYMAGVILGIEYALANDVEIFIYIEQDALIYGDGLINKIKKCLLKSDLVFGDGGKFSNIEQSIFAINRKGMRRFLSALHAIQYTDRQIEPELKFMYAASNFKHLPLLGLMSWDQPRLLRRASTIMLHRLMPFIREFEILPFGYGRVRPINFDDKLFYFQQGSVAEIERYKALTGF